MYVDTIFKSIQVGMCNFTHRYFFSPDLNDRMSIFPMVDQPQRQRLYALLGRVEIFQSFVQTSFSEAGHGRCLCSSDINNTISPTSDCHYCASSSCTKHFNQTTGSVGTLYCHHNYEL